MSMIKCPDCKNEMSDNAQNCPKCGRLNRKVGLSLFLGITFLPVIFSWLTLRKGHTNKARFFTFAWLFLFAFFINYSSGIESNSVSTFKKQTQKKVIKTVTKVNINSILKAYESNEVGADNQYKGRYIEVTGLIGDIKKDILDNLYVTIGTGKQFEIPQIQAFFDDSMNSQLGQLRKGNNITITGKVDGLMMNVLMKDCMIK